MYLNGDKLELEFHLRPHAGRWIRPKQEPDPVSLFNNAIKVRYHIQKLGEKSLFEQFNTLTDSAVYTQTDPLWQQTWNMPSDLEFCLLYEHPDQFITNLFHLLDQHSIKYTDNREYCHKSIDYYKSTLPSREQHLYNFNSLLWLSWCHADVLIRKDSLSETITEEESSNSFFSFLTNSFLSERFTLTPVFRVSPVSYC